MFASFSFYSHSPRFVRIFSDFFAFSAIYSRLFQFARVLRLLLTTF
ncbi:hypothetical protein J2T56_002800 [Natronobacillus azotifigens]